MHESPNNSILNIFLSIKALSGEIVLLIIFIDAKYIYSLHLINVIQIRLLDS